MTSDARLEAGRLRVTFERCGDRYGHRVELVEADKATLLLESIEGTPEEDWPASPALKELHLEDRPDGKQLALLVGMAGRSHWSLSVELDPKTEQLVFDVACRLRDEPLQLTSTYRAKAPPVELRNDPPRVFLSEELELQLQSIEGHAADMMLAAPGLIIIQSHIGTGKWPQTIRSRYAICAANIR